jgi:hypothetical protein
MKRLLYAVVLMICVQGLSVYGEGLSASAFKVDITPQSGIKMWGYSTRQGNSNGVLDPLFAKGLVLSDGQVRVALITLDLGRTFAPVAMGIVRENAKSKGDIDEVLFFASHTHSGPSLESHLSKEDIPAWEMAMLEKISDGIVRASQTMVPAAIGTGIGEAWIGHNRIKVQPDGSVKMFWRNPTKVPTSPVDDHVGVLRIDNLNTEPLAVLVNYSCHPVVLGPDNLQYSADFPGAMSRVVESELGDGVICLFLQGAPGDINPYFDKTLLRENGVELMRETGEELGREVVRVAKAIRPEVPEKASIRYSLDTLPFQLRWDRDTVINGLKSMAGAAAASRYEKLFSQEMELPVTTLVINEEIALTGMPGEPYVQFAMQSRQIFPTRSTFFAGYANGYFGYFPTLQGAVTGGYGGNSLVAWVEVGAGERMLEHSLVTAYEMLGELKNTPGP